MAERRTYQGGIYEREGPGQPWRLVGQVPGGQGTIVSDPQQPHDVAYRAAQARRETAEADVARDRALAETQRAQAQATQAQQTGRPGQERLDQEYAQRFADWRLRGAQDVQRNIAQLRTAYETLGNTNVTGRVLGRLPDFMLDDRVVDTRELVEEVVQRNLRTILGAQFTEREGERLIARAYNPRLDESVNRERLGRLIHQMEAAAAANDDAARFFEQNGTLQGWSGQVWNAGDFNPERDVPRQAGQGQSGFGGFDEEGRLVVNVTGGQPSGFSPEEGPPVTVGEGFNPEPIEPTAPPGSYNDSLLAQGIYGLNEGIASTIGAPVDLATSALNLIPAGIDAIANTNLGRIEDPLLGGDWVNRRFRDMGFIGPEGGGETRGFVRRVMQSPGAALIPAGATARTSRILGTGLTTALGGGVGATTAQQIAPDNPIAEIGGELIGSAGSGAGLFGLARRNARRTAEAAVPTTDALRREAGDLYRQAEARGVVAGPNVTQNLAGRIRQIGQDEAIITPAGRVLPGYDRFNTSLTALDDFAGRDMSAREIDRVRRILSGNVRASADSNERRINSMILSAFDEETLPLAPEFQQARNVASRYLQADTINEARDLSAPRAAQYSQSGEDNALRTEFRNLDRRIVRGDENFPDPVIEAIQNVSRGSPMSNAVRNVGKLAPRGVVSFGAGAGVPFMAGNAIGGPAVGAAMGGGAMATGEVARALATRMTRRNAEVAELLARAGGEIPIAPVIDGDIARMIALGLVGQSSNAAGVGR